jgi:hypothetical protein
MAPISPEQKEKLLRTADRLSEGFRSQCESHPGRQVPAELVLSYLHELRSVLKPVPLADWPDIFLGNIVILDDFVLPKNEWPAVNFLKTEFRGNGTFDGSTFLGEFNFSGCTNGDGKQIVFGASVFSGAVNFTQARSGSLCFERNTVFQGNADFSHGAKLTFENVVFRGKCKCEGTALIRLNGVEFDSDALFSNLKDTSSLEFREVIFRAGTVFHGRLAGANFVSTHFEKRASFQSVHFTDNTRFRSSRFQGEADFRGCTISDSFHFEGVTFVAPPAFFIKGDLPPDANMVDCSCSRFETVGDANAYRELRKRFSAESSLFFAYEQRTLRELTFRNRGYLSFPAWISRLYDWFSMYGHSVARPMIGLVVVNYCALIIYGAAFEKDIGAQVISGSWSGGIYGPLGLLLQNIFSPFTMFAKQSAFQIADPVLVLVSLSQSILSLLFGTLLFLAIRRRFRKDNE